MLFASSAVLFRICYATARASLSEYGEEVKRKDSKTSSSSPESGRHRAILIIQHHKPHHRKKQIIIRWHRNGNTRPVDPVVSTVKIYTIKYGTVRLFVEPPRKWNIEFKLHSHSDSVFILLAVWQYNTNTDRPCCEMTHIIILSLDFIILIMNLHVCVNASKLSDLRCFHRRFGAASHFFYFLKMCVFITQSVLPCQTSSILTNQFKLKQIYLTRACVTLLNSQQLKYGKGPLGWRLTLTWLEFINNWWCWREGHSFETL